VAAAHIAALLRPGGYVIWTAPFLEPTHGVPNDFFRFTVMGGAYLLRDAGLHIVATATAGDATLTSAYLLGYSAGELDEGGVASHLLSYANETELRRVSHDMDRDALSRKLYFSSCVLARSPPLATAAEAANRTRVVWTRARVAFTSPISTTSIGESNRPKKT